MPLTQAQRDQNNYLSLLGMPIAYDQNGNPVGGAQPNTGQQVAANQAAPQTATAAATPQTAAGPSVGQANMMQQPTQELQQQQPGGTVTGSQDQFFLSGSGDMSGYDPSMLPSNGDGSSGGSGSMGTYGGGGSPTIYQAGSQNSGGGIGQMGQTGAQGVNGAGGGGGSGFGQIGATNGGSGIFSNAGNTSITPRSSGINTSGAASAYIQDTDAAYKAAQAANKQMYNTINGEYNQNKADLSGGYAQMLGLTSNLGSSETAQNQQLTQQQTSDATQRAISQGLGNTTVLSGMQQGAQNAGQLRQLGINNQVANQQLGVLNTSIQGMQNNSLAQQNFQERVQNPYPNTSGYLQAIQMGGSGKFYGQ